MGGAATINQYLAAGLVDELRLHIAPFTLGAGTRVFERVPPLDLEQVMGRAASSVTHVTYRLLRNRDHADVSSDGGSAPRGRR